MGAIQKWLAILLLKIWDKFKQSNPETASAIAVLAGLIFYYASQGTFLGMVQLDPFWSKVIAFLAGFWGFLNSTSTKAKLAELQGK